MDGGTYGNYECEKSVSSILYRSSPCTALQCYDRLYIEDIDARVSSLMSQCIDEIR